MRTEVKALDASWAPWKFAVWTYSNGRDYGYPDGREIVTGTINFETQAELDAYLAKQ